jgi:hypothetical protein
MAERRAGRWRRRALAQPRSRAKPHENGILLEFEDDRPLSGRSVSWTPYGTPGEASREYAETVETLRSLQTASWARQTTVSLVHFGEVQDEAVVAPSSGKRGAEPEPTS